MEEAKEAIKRVGKTIARSFVTFLLPVLLIVVIIGIVLAGAVYYLDVWVDGIERDGDWSSVPFATGSYINNTIVNQDGTLSSNMTPEELWEIMKKNDSRIELYLSGPEELARLMSAETITQYPDTRPNPDAPVSWDEMKDDISKIHGIIKFKRAGTDGSKKTMTYVDPATFQGYVEAYNMTGSESAKQEALSHFTLEKRLWWLRE